MQEVLSEPCPSNTQPTTTHVQEVVLMTTESQSTQNKSTLTDPIFTSEKGTQFNFKEKVNFRSKAIQTRKILTKEIAVSPYKHFVTSSYTSPFKIELSHDVNPSRFGKTNIKKCIGFTEDEKSDSDVSSYPVAPRKDSTFIVTSSSKISDSSTTVADVNEDIDKMQKLSHTLRLIIKKPMMYIGVPKEVYFIVHLIHKHTNILHEHILLCLKKIRLNTTFSELEDNFGLSLSYASKLFLKNIPIIASVLRPFIVSLDKYSIKKTLPIPFRYKYYNVSCIIDCLEIDIQKPSNALFQAQTWSDYKKNNTVKFLISCTPNGLINYISPGFGGRASDVTIVQNCNFLDTLEPGNFVLADRGFKHVESILDAKGIKLLRPPSVASGSKLSKSQVRETKIIASLRIHIERVIRRVREFHMLKQHSVINKHFLRILNDVIVIACALINLQDSLIK
ncbi:hypothetical protein ACJJTC_007261 [Scirpophaga incertulas]